MENSFEDLVPSAPRQSIVPPTQTPSSGGNSFEDLVPTSNVTMSPSIGKDTPSFNDKYLQDPNNPGILREGGILARSAAPYLAAAGTGAGTAALLSSVFPLAEPIAIPTGAMAGVGAYGASQLYNMVTNVANEDVGTRLPMAGLPETKLPLIPEIRNYTDKAADYVGLPRRDTYSMPERFASTAYDTAGNVASGYGLGSTLLKYGVAKGLGTALTSNVGQQLLAGQGAGAASQAASEVGINDPAAQLAIGYAGAHAPMAINRAFVPHTESAVNKVQADPEVKAAGTPENIDTLNADIAAREKGAQNGLDLPNTMTGQLLQNPYWKGIEARETGDNRVVQNRINNDIKMAHGVHDVIAPPENYENNLSPVLDAANQEKISTAQAGVDAAQKSSDVANTSLQDTRSELTDNPPQMGAKASESALKTKNLNEDNHEAIVEKMYDDAKQPNISYQPVFDAIDNALSNKVKTQTGTKQIPGVITDIRDELLENGLNGASDKPVEWNRLLNKAIREANSTGDSFSEGLLNDVKTGVRTSLENVPEFSAANKYYAENIGKVFKEGPQGESAKRSSLPTEYLDKSTQSIEGARQLKQAVNYENDPAVQKNVRDHWMDKLSQARDNKNKPTSSSVGKFLRDNSDVLSEFPKVQDEISRFRNNLANGEGRANTLSAELDERSKNLDATKRTVEGSFENQVSKDPVNFWNDIIGDAKKDSIPIESLRKIQKLKDVIANDPTGAAKETLVNSLKQWLTNNPQGLKMSGQSVASPKIIAGDEASVRDWKISPTKLSQLLSEGGPGRMVLESVLGKETMDGLSQFHKASMKENNNVLSGIHGSPTPEKTAAAENAKKPGVVGAAVGAVARHSIGRMTTSILTHLGVGIQKGLSGDDSAMVRKLQLDALFDKPLAKAIMTDPKSESGIAAKKVIQDWQSKNSNQGPVRNALNKVAKNAPMSIVPRTIGGIEGSMTPKKNDTPQTDQ